MRFLNDDVKWTDFRKKYIENGGDGIYAAWMLCYLEDSIDDVKDFLRPMGLAERFNTDKHEDKWNDELFRRYTVSKTRINLLIEMIF